jgi:hypothetical protein
VADYDKLLGNLQTVFVELSDFQFEAVERTDGRATVIRFRIPEPVLLRGDILVVLDGGEIRFHGAISSVDASGCAVASDFRGSTIPAANR